jgi:hypothetical protein
MVISGEFTNSNGFINISNVTVSVGGSLINNIGATINNLGDSVNNYGTFVNSGVYIHDTYLPVNNYATIINTGTWGYFNWNNSINNTSSGSIVNSGEMKLSGASYNSGTITNSGNINLADGYGGSNAGSIQGAGKIVNNGVINVPYAASINAASVTNNGNINIGGRGFSGVIGDITGTGSLTIKSLAFDGGSGSLAVSGNVTQSSLNVISGSIGVGGNINTNVVLGNAEYYDYLASLNASNINGDLTVYSNGVVNGVKSITGNVSLIGGKLNAFDSMSIDGNLLTSSSSTEIDFFINGTSVGDFSFIKVKGFTTFSGGLININFGNYKPLLGQSWEVLSADGGIVGFDSLILSGGASAYPFYETPQFALSTLNGSLFVTVTAVPEQDTYAMLLAGLGMMGWIVRRKQK